MIYHFVKTAKIFLIKKKSNVPVPHAIYVKKMSPISLIHFIHYVKLAPLDVHIVEIILPHQIYIKAIVKTKFVYRAYLTNKKLNITPMSLSSLKNFLNAEFVRLKVI